MSEQWIPAAEAQKKLDVGRGRVLQLCRQGDLDAKQCLPRDGWLIDADSVAEYREQVKKPTSLSLKETIQASNLYLTGEYSLRELGRLLGVSKGTIRLAWERHKEHLPHEKLEIVKSWLLVTHGQAKVTPKDVQRIRLLWKEDVPATEIARRFSISRTVAYRIATYKAWQWVPDPRERQQSETGNDDATCYN